MPAIAKNDVDFINQKLCLFGLGQVSSAQIDSILTTWQLLHTPEQHVYWLGDEHITKVYALFDLDLIAPESFIKKYPIGNYGVSNATSSTAIWYSNLTYVQSKLENNQRLSPNRSWSILSLIITTNEYEILTNAGV